MAEEHDQTAETQESAALDTEVAGGEIRFERQDVEGAAPGVSDTAATATTEGAEPVGAAPDFAPVPAPEPTGGEGSSAPQTPAEADRAAAEAAPGLGSAIGPIAGAFVGAFVLAKVLGRFGGDDD